MKTWPPTGSISEGYAVREWRKKLEASGFRVIDERWEPARHEKPLPEPLVKIPPRT